MFSQLPQITILYAGILGLVATGLAAFAGSMRGKTKISIGDGGNQELLLAMRRHANFVESVPLLLILFALLEMNGVGDVPMHIMGAGLVVARVAHAVGLKADSVQNLGRFVGAAGTALLTVVASIWAIVTFF